MGCFLCGVNFLRFMVPDRQNQPQESTKVYTNPYLYFMQMCNVELDCKASMETERKEKRHLHVYQNPHDILTVSVAFYNVPGDKK